MEITTDASAILAVVAMEPEREDGSMARIGKELAVDILGG